jgi:predicted kinase
VEQPEHDADVRQLMETLVELPEPVAAPFLIVVSGLPGTGKTYFCRQLARKLPAVILESDYLRRLLFPTPAYRAAESVRLFRACHLLIERLLKWGVPVIFDATNLAEHYRERFYRITGRLGARLVLVRVEAPPELVYQRLRARQGNGETNSDADWAVYRRMKPQIQRIHRRHYAVDTSRDITPVISKIVREINR